MWQLLSQAVVSRNTGERAAVAERARTHPVRYAAASWQN